MRLTLRTLLAYMDDILEPKDTQEIAKKVQESDFASGLLQRIRDVTRHLRSPGTNEADASLDPNTVAEYLDNTLAADRVPDFEKACLESDVRLGELGSCHQILTLVLGEPAEVDPESRLRMYRIPETAVSPQTEVLPPGPGAGDGRPPATAAAVSDEPKHEVPAYLRERRSRRLWPVTVTSLIAIAAIVGLFATGQFRSGKPLGDLFSLRGRTDEVASIPSPTGSSPLAAENLAAPPVESVAASPAIGAASVGLAEAAVETSLEPPIKQPTQSPRPTAVSADSAVSRPDAPLPEDIAANTILPKAQVPAASEPSAPAMPGTAANSVESSADMEQPIPAGTETVGSSTEQPVPSNQPAERTAPATEMESAGKPASAPVPEMAPAPIPASGSPVGTFLSATEVLVRLDPNSHWQRIPAQAVLNEGDEIVSLPTYRPTISIQGGVTVQLFDGSRVGLLPLDPSGIAGLDIRYGRLVVKPGDTKDGRLRLQIGERGGVVGFGDADSILLVEVGCPATASADPETEPAPVVADLYSASGSIQWQETGGGELVPLTAPMKVRLDGGSLASVAAQTLPEWTSPEAVSLLDQRASATVGRALTLDRRASLTLHELALHRQREVRWLAMRCLGHLGDFGLLVEAFNDPEQKLVWQDHVDELRRALDRGPGSASRVREAMEYLYAGNGRTLYELLWKYRKPELDQSETARLITMLEHELLPVRVLSFWNLREVTGLTLYYRPEYPAAKRTSSVQKWRERMGTGPVAPEGVQIPPIDSDEP